MYNFNPHSIGPIYIDSNYKNTYITDKLIQTVQEIQMTRHKYINQINTTYINDTTQSFSKLFSLPNNFSQYLVQLWTQDFKPNVYYNIATNDFNAVRTDQEGGQLKRIHFNKIKQIIKDLNITPEIFYDIIKSIRKQYKIKIDGDVLTFIL